MKTTTIKEEGLSKIFQIILPQTELQKAINSRLQEVYESDVCRISPINP